MAAVVECWDGSDGDQVHGPPGQEHRTATLRLGVLFFDGRKICFLPSSLAGPPEQENQNEVLLRLVGGRFFRIVFDEQKNAENMLKACLQVWQRAVKSRSPELAAKLARLLEGAAPTVRLSAESIVSEGQAPSTVDAGERKRERSSSPEHTGQARRLLRRLSSIEVEGKYRWQRTRDLEEERVELESLQQEQLLIEHRMRHRMTREQFRQSLQKENETYKKIQLMREEEEKERNRFEQLKMDEARLVREIAGKGEQPAQEEPAATEDAATCIICRHSQRCIVFMPCKHFSCCAKCSEVANKCPVCRQPVQFSFRVLVS